MKLITLLEDRSVVIPQEFGPVFVSEYCSAYLYPVTRIPPKCQSPFTPHLHRLCLHINDNIPDCSRPRSAHRPSENASIQHLVEPAVGVA